jgi:hypothetical protein
VRALQQLPEVAVAGAVVQHVVVADRRPLRGLRGLQDLDRLVDLGDGGREGVDDGADLRRVDAPHPRVAEAARGDAGRLLQRRGVLELGNHAVRRHFALGVAGGGDLQLGAHDQRVLELALHAHRALRDGAAVRRDEVHQPEAQRLDARVRRQRPHVLQRAVRLHQRVQRDVGAAAGIDRGRGALQFCRVARLGAHQVGRAPARRQHDGHHVGEARVVHRQHAHAHAAEAVERIGQQPGDQVRLLDLAAHGRAVLVVQRDVEHRAQLGLQLQALAHARLDAAVVVADRQRRHGTLVGVEQGLAGVQGGDHRAIVVRATPRSSRRRGAPAGVT